MAASGLALAMQVGRYEGIGVLARSKVLPNAAL